MPCALPGSAGVQAAAPIASPGASRQIQCGGAGRCRHRRGGLSRHGRPRTTSVRCRAASPGPPRRPPRTDPGQLGVLLGAPPCRDTAHLSLPLGPRIGAFGAMGPRAALGDHHRHSARHRPSLQCVDRRLPVLVGAGGLRGRPSRRRADRRVWRSCRGRHHPLLRRAHLSRRRPGRADQCRPAAGLRRPAADAEGIRRPGGDGGPHGGRRLPAERPHHFRLRRTLATVRCDRRREEHRFQRRDDVGPRDGARDRSAGTSGLFQPQLHLHCHVRCGSVLAGLPQGGGALSGRPHEPEPRDMRDRYPSVRSRRFGGAQLGRGVDRGEGLDRVRGERRRRRAGLHTRRPTTGNRRRAPSRVSPYRRPFRRSRAQGGLP